MSYIVKFICFCWRWFNNILDFLSHFGDLIIRLWVARVFFKAGLTKIASWSSTIALFTYEYNVPLISAEWAARIGTAVELVLPVFLVLGLGGRVPALFLFVFNIFAVISYPFLLTEQGASGLNDHFYWGLLLMVLMLHGSGKISLDYIIKWIYSRKKSKS